MVFQPSVQRYKRAQLQNLSERSVTEKRAAENGRRQEPSKGKGCSVQNRLLVVLGIKNTEVNSLRNLEET